MGQSEIPEGTTTKTIIRNYFVIGLLFLGVFSALSQLFAEVKPKDIQLARKEHRAARDLRDNYRIESFVLLQKLLDDNIVEDERFKSDIGELLINHSQTEKLSEELYKALNETKAANRVSGFPTLNSFLDGIGNPIFILVIGFLFLVLYFNRRRINWNQLPKSFLPASLMCFFVSGVYLIWVFTPSTEISRVYYIVALFLASIACTFTLYKILKFLFVVDYKDLNFREACKMLLDYIINDVKDLGYIKEGKRKDYNISNDRIINEVAETLKK